MYCLIRSIELWISLVLVNPRCARKILVAMHLPADVPELHPARPPPGRAGELGDTA
jgi:hypothetical protein